MNRHSLVSKQAYAYANIAAVVFKTGPLNYIGAGKPKKPEVTSEGFRLCGGSKKFTTVRFK